MKNPENPGDRDRYIKISKNHEKITSAKSRKSRNSGDRDLIFRGMEYPDKNSPLPTGNIQHNFAQKSLDFKRVLSDSVFFRLIRIIAKGFLKSYLVILILLLNNFEVERIFHSFCKVNT